MTFNLNKEITVKLSDAGKKYLDSYIRNQKKEVFDSCGYVMGKIPGIELEGDKLTGQAYLIFNIFGEYLSVGQQLPFNMNIELKMKPL